MLIDDERLVRSGDSWVAVGGSRTLPFLLDPWAPRGASGPAQAARARRHRAGVGGPQVFYSGAIEALFGDDRPPPNSVSCSSRSSAASSCGRTVRPSGPETYRFRHQLIRDTALGVPQGPPRLAPRAVRGMAGTGRRRPDRRTGGDPRVPPGAGAPLPTGARPGRDRTRSSASARGCACSPPARRASERGPRSRGEPPSACGQPAPVRSPDRAEVLYDLGRANSQVGDVRDSFATFDQAVDAADAAGDPIARVAHPHRSVRNSHAHGPHDQATDIAFPGRARAGPRGVRGAR